MNIENIKPSRAFVIVICGGIFFEVILSFFLLNRALFASLNIWQLVGIGLGVSIPILILGCISYAVFFDNGSSEEDEEDNLNMMGAAGLISLVVFTGCLLVSYYYSFSLKKFYWIVFFGLIGGVSCIFIILRLYFKDRVYKDVKEVVKE